MKKNSKGITLAYLVITIIIILILTSTIITSTYTGADYKRYKLMCADIEMLENKTLMYYNKYGALPITGDALTSDLPEAIRNGHSFYRIDIGKLNNVTLNFGETDDIYIIDSMTFEVYYLNGIEYKGEIHYTD